MEDRLPFTLWNVDTRDHILTLRKSGEITGPNKPDPQGPTMEFLNDYLPRIHEIRVRSDSEHCDVYVTAEGVRAVHQGLPAGLQEQPRKIEAGD